MSEKNKIQKKGVKSRMRTRENLIKSKLATIPLVFVVMFFLVLAFFSSPIFFQEGNPLPVLRALIAVEFLNRDLARG